MENQEKIDEIFRVISAHISTSKANLSQAMEDGASQGLRIANARTQDSMEEIELQMEQLKQLLGN